MLMFQVIHGQQQQAQQHQQQQLMIQHTLLPQMDLVSPALHLQVGTLQQMEQEQVLLVAVHSLQHRSMHSLLQETPEQILQHFMHNGQKTHIQSHLLEFMIASLLKLLTMMVQMQLQQLFLQAT